MRRHIFSGIAKLLLWSASSLFIAGLIAMGISTFLLTWPLVWGSPERRKLKSGVQLASSVMQFLSTMRPENEK